MPGRYRNILSAVAGGSNDPDAQAYINALDAAGYTVSSEEEVAINDHFLDLKGTGPNNSTYDWWTGIVRLLPFIGTTAAQQGIKAESPASSTTFAGGVTHNSTGVEGNGTNGYYVFFNPSELTDVNDWSAWVYKRKNIVEAKWDFSADANQPIRIQSRYSGDRLFATAAGQTLVTAVGTITNGANFVGITKFQNIGFDAYVRGTRYQREFDTFTNPGIDIYGLASSRATLEPYGYSANEHAYALVTTGISTTTEEAALRACVEAFMTALGRIVDADAQAYIDALDSAGYTVSASEKTAITNHFLDLKGQGPNNSTYDWWTGCVRLLPFIGTNAAQQGIEGQNPASSINFYGGMIFSSIGAEGNGTNAYFDFFAPNELPDDRNNSIWVYETKNLAPTNYTQYSLYRGYFDQRFEGGLINSYQLTTQYIQNRTYGVHGDYYYAITTPDGSLVPPSTGGFFGTTRYKSIAQGGGWDLYAKGVKFTQNGDINQQYNTSAQIVPGLAHRTYLSYSQGVNTFQPLAFGYALITTGVSTQTEADALKVTVEAFMTALNRNV